MKHKFELPAQLEPKRNNRFIVEFPKEFDIESWMANKVSKPKYYIDTSKKDANGIWHDIKISFIDPIEPSTSERLFKLIDIFKNKKEGEFFAIKIKTVDPVGEEVEMWVIKAEELLSIDFGELDYNDNSIQTPSIIIKPNSCYLDEL